MEKLNSDAVEAALQLVRSGVEYKEAARRSGVSERSLFRYARRAGLTKAPAAITANVLQELASKGVHQAEAARRLRVSRATVYDACRKHGVTLPCGRKDPVEARRKSVAVCLKRSAEEAALLGWPEVERRIHARILSVLEHGPYTEKQVAEQLCWRTNIKGQSSKLNAAMRGMLKKRLVERTRVGHSWEYRVADWLLEQKEQRDVG